MKTCKELTEPHQATNHSTKETMKGFIDNCTRIPTTDLDDDVDDTYFNSFLYWRNPLPQVDLGDFNFGKSDENSGKTVFNPGCDSHLEDTTSDVGDKGGKMELVRGEDGSDSEEELEHPLFSLTDDLNDEFDYDDYHKVKLQHSTSFEEELLLADHLTPPPKQVTKQVFLVLSSLILLHKNYLYVIKKIYNLLHCNDFPLFSFVFI